MSSLLPDVVREALHGRGDGAAAESFGTVTLVLLIVLLVERELLRVMRVERVPPRALSAVALPLGVAVVLTIAVRIGDLLP